MIYKEIIKNTTVKIILSNPLKKTSLKKIEILKKQDEYRISRYENNQVFNEKIDKNEINSYLNIYINNFKQINIWDDEYEYTIRFTKNGKQILSKSKIKEPIIINTKHNREKNYLIKEGTIVEPLIDLGIFTKDGKVVNSMYDKFKQINRFLELINDALTEKDENLNILDFGSGKSYLTFVLYYFLTEIKKINVSMVGLDLKEDVIKKCNEIANKYNYNNLKFEVGDIQNYKYKDNIDMVISLHACDIATDYALFNAVKWNARMIFSVPCCQHELNTQIKTEKYNILTRYGIAKERYSAILTDVIRCNLLIASGYKTQLLEFVDFSHTPKNLLIRATKTNIPNKTKEIVLNEVEQIVKEFNLRPKLYELLNDIINSK